ncbi:hypothetical protein DFS34DRAFT_649615 [Phlyctochytrium arcticum]|nr:hypothetical protein DFS34DRAFT_649615 [Phlyctochytrium arcticum]
MDSTCLFAHVDHVLVAEFDIDKGSSITYQYPEDTGTDVQYVFRFKLWGEVFSSSSSLDWPGFSCAPGCEAIVTCHDHDLESVHFSVSPCEKPDMQTNGCIAWARDAVRRPGMIPLRELLLRLARQDNLKRPSFLVWRGSTDQ